MKRLGVVQAKKMLREGWTFRLPGQTYVFAFRGHKIGPGLAEASILRGGALTWRVFHITPAAEELLRRVEEERAVLAGEV